jgi:hypothetical protein
MPQMDLKLADSFLALRAYNLFYNLAMTRLFLMVGARLIPPLLLAVTSLVDRFVRVKVVGFA